LYAAGVKLLLALLVITPVARAATDCVVPIAGQWRDTRSTVILSNRTASTVPVDVAFLPPDAGKRAHADVKPRETRSIDVAMVMLDKRDFVGGIRVHSPGEISASVRVFEYPHAGALYDCVDVRSAIGVGESTRLSASGDARIFIAETRGFPLYLSATTDDGHSQRIYVGPNQQSTTRAGRAKTIELHGVNGSGRVVAAAATIAPDGDIVATQMEKRRGWRHRLPAAEIAAYAAIALFVSFYALKKR
jgi:hypothetical protein